MARIDSRPLGGSGGGGTPDDNSVTSAKIVDGAIVNADVNASAALALSKLATIANGAILGNNSGSTGVPLALTTAQVGSLLQAIAPGVARAVVKTADETVNNSTTLQNDDHLSFAVAANETWFFTMWLAITGVSANADVKMNWTVPAGASFRWGGNGNHSGNAAVFGGQFTAAGSPFALGTSADVIQGLAANTMGLSMAGWIYCGATPGTAQFQWAQNAAVAEDVKIIAGSWMSTVRLV